MSILRFFPWLFFWMLASSCGNPDTHRHDGGVPDAGADGDADADIQNPRPVDVRITAGEPFLIAQDGGHLAFPSIARRSDGGWILVYRQGSTHVDATGRIVKRYGSPDGRTWSEPETLVDTDGIDDRDPSVARLADGRLVVTWFQYRPQRVGSSTLVLHETFFVESADDGVTWSEPVQVTSGVMTAPDGAHLDSGGHWVDGAGDPIVVHASSAPLVDTEDGWVLPNYGGQALNLDAVASCRRSEVSLFVRPGGAGAWTERPVLPGALPNVWLQEPALLVTPEGRWILQARTAWGATPSTMGHLAQSISTDGGATWSPWEALGFVGHAPDLARAPNGVLFSAFREIDDAFTQEWVSLMASVDDAASWRTPPLRIADCGAMECGYPSLGFLDSDHLLMVYYGPGGTAIEGVVLSLGWIYEN